MKTSNIMRHAALLLALSLATVSVADSPPALAPGQFDSLLRAIKPSPNESAWSNIRWMTDLWEARQKAAKEGKPLVVWTMSGEPLGFC